jgi:hypothetical protein
VRVDDKLARTAGSIKQPSHFGNDSGWTTIGGIYMVPKAKLIGNTLDGGDWIDTGDRGSAGGGNNTEGLPSGGEVGGDGLPEQRRVHPVFAVDSDLANIVTAKAQTERALFD